MCFDVEEVRRVCVGCVMGLDRCCGESVVCVGLVGFLSVWDVRCILMLFEWFELTLMSAASHVRDCGVIWRLMVLGKQWLRAGARVFCGEGLGVVGG